MKSKYFLLIAILASSIQLFSQNKDLGKYISLYDSLYSRTVEVKYRPLDSINTYRTSIYGDGMSYALVADLIMFESTQDEKYLSRFIHNSTGMMLFRRDYVNPDDEPRWGRDPSMYHDGLLMWAYSYFIFRVSTINPIFTSYSLSDTLLLSISKLNNSIKTIKDLSDFFTKKIIETLEFYNKYWYGSKQGFKTSVSKSARPAHLNFQSAYGATYYYMGIVTKNPVYTERAHQLAKLYKGFVTDKPNCVGGSPVPPFSKRQVLEITADSCLIWMHWGWRPARCKNDYKSMDYDDISHGIPCMIFPFTILNTLKNSDSAYYFSDKEMVLLHNTFTKRIFAGYNGACPTFNSGIDGDNTINYEPKLSGINNLRVRCIAYSYLIPWDGKSGTSNQKIEKIILDFIQSECSQSSYSSFTGMDLYGLATFIREINH